MNKKKKSFIILATMYLLLLAILTTSFAWFFINKDITVEYGSEITCEAGSSLQISMLEGVDEETEEEIWSEYSGYVKFDGPSAKIEDISGDGKNLYRPTSLVTNPDTNELYPEGLTGADKINDEGFGDYIEMEIKLRTTSTMNVYFGAGSTATPLNTSDTDRNVYGNFSKHYIAGAIRVAVLEKDADGSEELKMIWAPNPSVQLSYNKTTAKYSLITNGAYEKYYYYKMNEETGEVEKYAVTQDDYASKLFVPGSTRTTESMVNNSPILTTMSPELNELVEQRLVIRVWYEGTDREADQALSGGQVNLNLKFIGMQEKAVATEENIELIDSIEAVKSGSSYIFENITEDVYYSVNGYSWSKYSDDILYSINTNINNMLAEQQKDIKIYFKTIETTTNYEYIKAITIPYAGGTTNES